MSGKTERAVDWGKPGGDKTIITLTTTDNSEKAAAKIADAVRWLQQEYPGAEIQVHGLDGRSWEVVKP